MTMNKIQQHQFIQSKFIQYSLEKDISGRSLYLYDYFSVNMGRLTRINFLYYIWFQIIPKLIDLFGPDAIKGGY